MQLTNRIHTVALRQHEVHEYDARLKPARQLHGLVAVGGLADDVHVGLQGKECAQALTDDGVIVDQ